jgi:glutathione S-transferase
LAPPTSDPNFAAYQQLQHLGEAGLAASAYFVNSARNLAPEAERENHTGLHALETYQTRLRLVTRQLARFPHMAGEAFTAADISVTYAIELARKGARIAPGEAERAYVARTSSRDAFKRAMDACQATKAWTARVDGAA